VCRSDETDLRLPPESNGRSGISPLKLWFHDINGDGHNEILFKLFGEDFQIETDIDTSYLNLGNVFFTPLPDNWVDLRPNFAPVDVNGDGYVDFVKSRFGFNSLGEAELFLTKAVVPSKLTNISTRGLVQTGGNVQIGGFIIGGTEPKTVLIRARGPVLTDFGVPGKLNDPFLQLFSGQTVIAH